MKLKTDVVTLMENARLNNTYLKVCAPMVRYSKVQFRSLVRNNGVDLCFTPMILADSFCQSSKARYNEFTTTSADTPLVVQFAAKNANEFVDASKLVYAYADGVDLNCGCPQRWAMKDGYGCALLSQPDVIHSLVRMFKNNLPNDFSVSVKIRLLKDLKKSIQLCQQLEKCGISFVTVHARTPSQKSSEDINIHGLREVYKSIHIPLVANGGVKSLNDADALYNEIKCSGVMAASGILTNPALFGGYIQTPLSCVQQWMDIKNRNVNAITFQCYHHHLVFMLEKILTKQHKKIFNYLNTFESVDNFLIQNIISNESTNNILEDDEFVHCDFQDSLSMKYSKCRRCCMNQYDCKCEKVYDSNNTQGKFFSSYLKDYDLDLDFMDSNIFEQY